MRSRVLFLGSSIVVTLLAGGALHYWATQAVSVRPVARHGADTPTASVNTVLATAYYTVTIPDAYTLREQHDDDGKVVSSLLATKSTQGGGQLAITIAELPSGGLNEAADIISRRERENLYDEAMLDGMPAGAIVFRSRQSNEVGVFWPYGNHYASVVLSNNGVGSDQANGHLTDMLRSWRWL